MSKQIKDILRCYAMGMGIRSISTVFNVSRNTVRKYVHVFQASGMSLSQFQSLSEHHLEEMFCSKVERKREVSVRQVELEALLPEYALRLKQKGTNVKLLYEEYKRQHPQGYHHTSFWSHLRRYTCTTHVVGHVDHRAGEQMYIDYAGDKLEVVCSETGEVQPVEVFVAILPCSHYTYCEASWSQSKEDLIRSCENALSFFGGVPMAIVPDNLKSAVTRSDKHEPVINEEFQSFSEHYQCAVYPARVRHPKDKALVENAVKLMYRSIYADIEGQIFHDIDSLNIAIRASLETFNRRKLTGRKESRWQLYEEIEKDFLRPLPATRYQLKERKSVTVMRNSYITLNKHYYSVPKEYIGKRVELVYDNERIDIYCGLRLVTSHQRDDRPYAYTQKDAHHLPGRQGSYEKDLDEVYQRAGAIDNIVLCYLKEVAATKKYPPQAFRSCRGILSLENKYGQDRLVAACACATQLRVYGYQDVLDILTRGADADYLVASEEDVSPAASPQHKNIRGKDYFSTSSQHKDDTNFLQPSTNNGNK